MSSCAFTKQIRQSFQYLIDDYNFSLVAERYDPKSFGNALVKYRSDTVDISIILEKGQIFVEFYPWFDTSKRKYSLADVLDYLAAHQPESDCIPPSESSEHQTQASGEIESIAQTLKQDCSAILHGQFTAWEFIGYARLRNG